jgi:formylglycine-generating enzyme required for sulfatase activity
MLSLLLAGGVFGIIGLILWWHARRRVSSKIVGSSITSSSIHINNLTTVIVDEIGQIVEKQDFTCQSFSEYLGNEITLEMVYINGGLFNIGSKTQEGDEREKPRHEVIIKAFLMGKYPVTQAQWQVIAELPKIKRELAPNPAKFKGDNLPVENVSWYDAVEFCQRLSTLTGREYRLPSEAEWEYACRGQTKTPFYFGPTITSNLANYKGIFSYGKEQKGEDRHITTPVGQFPPNSFGLYDLHGNIGEWCADTWHDNYQDAPADGSAWIKNKNEQYRVCSPVRGGAWIASPNDCRSASRKSEKRDRTNAYTGFRVVCEVGSLIFS